MALRCTLVRTSRRRRHGVTGPSIASQAGVLPLLAGESPRHGEAGHGEREDMMTEQPETPRRPDDEDGSHASVGKEPGQTGGGRTEGETGVDDALGQGEPPGRS
jgi:hypothetical protein